jgi:hypothetical protein
VSSLFHTIQATTGRRAVSLIPRLLLALGASILLTSSLVAIGAPLWLSAALGALAGARVAASRRLSGAAPVR